MSNHPCLCRGTGKYWTVARQSESANFAGKVLAAPRLVEVVCWYHSAPPLSMPDILFLLGAGIARGPVKGQ